MKIAIKTKFKNGALQAALDKRGWTQQQGADYFGVNAVTFASWLNMKRVPSILLPKFSNRKVGGLEASAFTELIEDFTGVSIDEIWPEESKTKEFLDAKKQKTFFIEAAPLALTNSVGDHTRMLELSPRDIIDKNEASDIVENLLATLTEREEQIIRMRMDGVTYKEIAERFGYSIETIRKAEGRGMDKMRKIGKYRYQKAGIN